MPPVKREAPKKNGPEEEPVRKVRARSGTRIFFLLFCQSDAAADADMSDRRVDVIFFHARETVPCLVGGGLVFAEPERGEEDGAEIVQQKLSLFLLFRRKFEVRLFGGEFAVRLELPAGPEPDEVPETERGQERVASGVDAFPDETGVSVPASAGEFFSALDFSSAMAFSNSSVKRSTSPARLTAASQSSATGELALRAEAAEDRLCVVIKRRGICLPLG